MESNSWNEKEIFMVTPENPDHEYVFDSTFNEASSGKNGFYLVGLEKVTTKLNDRGSLMVSAYKNGQFVAKDFYFDFVTKNKQVVFYRVYIGEKETGYFGFEVKE